MRKHVSAASAILAATASFVFSGTVPVQAAPAPAQAAADRALLFLSRAQAADGSVGGDAGVTEDTVLGTAAAGHDPNTLVACGGSTALGYLGGVADANYTTLSAGQLGKLILAVVAAGQNPRGFGKSSQHDLVAQLQTLKPAQTFDQALAILADKAAGATIPAAAVSALKASQDTDGGWNYTGAKDNAAGSDTNSTAIALEALAAAGDHSTDATALAWLATQQQADGGYPYQGSPSDPDSDAIVIQALAAQGRDTSRPLANLTGMQDQATGGFTYPGNAGPDAFTTAQVPAGLMLAHLPVSPAYTAGNQIPGAGCLSTQGAYQSLSAPARIYDSRTAGGPFGAGETRWVQVAGHGGVPASGATAVVLTVTVTNQTRSGYVTVWPAGLPRPNASSLNWIAGTYSNQVTVAGSGLIAIYNLAGSTDVVVDAVGYFAPAAAGGRYVALTPQRLLDTRLSGGQTKAGQPLTVSVPAGVVPVGASAVVLNVTVTDQGSWYGGYLTVYPGAGAPPSTSSVNWQAPITTATRVTSGIDSAGRFSISDLTGGDDVVVDLNGYYTGAAQQGGALFTPQPPARALDTRTGSVPVAQQPLAVPLAGSSGVPAGASAVALNVTVTDLTGDSWLGLWPAGEAQPGTSDVNWARGQILSNAAIVRLGAGGALDAYVHTQSADVILDVVGYYS